MEQSASRTAPPPAPAPAPAAPLDLDQLGDRIAELSARIQAATYDLLCDLRVFDRRHGWEGFRSCAHWLNWRTGLDLGAAREKLRVAAAMACGVLSYSKVRALSRVATPRTEARLLAVACGATAEQVERLVRGWRRVDREQAAAGDDGAQVRLARRGLRLRVDEDGTVVLRGRLLPEVGAVVLRALEAALEQVPAAAADGTECTASQRRADALGVVAESALAGKLDPGAAGDRYQVTVHVEAAALAAGETARETAPETARDTASDAPEISAETCAGAPAAAASAPGGRTRGPAGRPSRANATAAAASAATAAAAGCAAADAGAVSAETRGTGRTAPPAMPAAPCAAGETAAQPVAPPVTAPVADAPEHPEARHPAAGAAVIEQANGIHLAATAARRIACDAGRVLVAHAPDGAVLEVGRRTRTVPTPLRRALEVRDHHQCQFPGCQLRHCDAHHVVHWADGGATRLPNLICVATTTGRCTRRGFRWSLARMGSLCSGGRMVRRCRRCRWHLAGRGRRWSRPRRGCGRRGSRSARIRRRRSGTGSRSTWRRRSTCCGNRRRPAVHDGRATCRRDAPAPAHGRAGTRPCCLDRSI